MMMTDIRVVANEDGTCDVHAEGTGKFITVKADGFDLALGFKEYNAGKKIQDAFPFLNAEEREFILTGLTPEEQERFFNDDKYMGSSIIIDDKEED